MHKVITILQDKLALVALAALCFAGFALATPSEAHAKGFEVGGAFGYAGNVDDDAEDMNGFTFTLMVGYRAMDWLAIELEQDLGGIFWEGGKHDWSAFYGATMFEGRFIYALKAFELFAKLGLGAVYIAGDDEVGGVKFNWDNAWFGLRLGIGADYMISSNLGVGLNFDYTPSFDDDHVDHFLRFQAHFVYQF